MTLGLEEREGKTELFRIISQLEKGEENLTQFLTLSVGGRDGIQVSGIKENYNNPLLRHYVESKGIFERRD